MTGLNASFCSLSRKRVDTDQFLWLNISCRAILRCCVPSEFNPESGKVSDELELISCCVPFGPLGHIVGHFNAPFNNTYKISN